MFYHQDTIKIPSRYHQDTIKIPGTSKSTISEVHQRLARDARSPPQPRGLERLVRVAVRVGSDCGFWDAWLAKRAQERERGRWALAGRSSHTSAAGKNIVKVPRSMGVWRARMPSNARCSCNSIHEISSTTAGIHRANG